LDNTLLALGHYPVLVGWTEDGLSLFVAVEEDVTWMRRQKKIKSKYRKFAQSSRKTRKTNLTLILDELALVVAFPERAEHGFIRERVVLADERLQVSSGLRAVVCGSQR